jgi:hypothetical protein
MAGTGKPNFMSAMAVLKGKVIKGLAPTGDSPSNKAKKPTTKKIFGKKSDKFPMGGKSLPDVQNK